jgi:hypothetical protein
MGTIIQITGASGSLYGLDDCNNLYVLRMPAHDKDSFEWVRIQPKFVEWADIREELEKETK